MSFRIEDKLLVSPQRLGDLYQWIASRSGRALHEKRLVYSTYLDSPSLAMFHDSEEGVVPRKKIRIRSYGGTTHSGAAKALEIKISSVEGRFKTTQDLGDRETDALLASGFFDDMYGMCAPSSGVAYMREYFAVAGVRLTVDQDIRYRAPDSRFWIDDAAVAIQIKAPHGSSIRYLENEFPFRRVRFSKYARSINATQRSSAAWI